MKQLKENKLKYKKKWKQMELMELIWHTNIKTMGINKLTNDCQKA